MDKYADIMLDHIPAGVALFDARDFRLLAANKLFYRFFQMHHVPSRDAETIIEHTLTQWLLRLRLNDTRHPRTRPDQRLVPSAC